MIARVVGIAVIAGALVIGMSAARAESKGCAEIAGGAPSQMK